LNIKQYYEDVNIDLYVDTHVNIDVDTNIVNGVDGDADIAAASAHDFTQH